MLCSTIPPLLKPIADTEWAIRLSSFVTEFMKITPCLNEVSSAASDPHSRERDIGG
jgi:hypothetical protein